MSFIDVAEGGFDETSFKASLQFKTLVAESNKIRFDDLRTSLTHILYMYDLDHDGNFIYITDADGNRVPSKEKISDDFFDVEYLQDGTIKIKAYKSLGGGIFRLVLATKDSYNNFDEPGLIDVQEKYFSTKYAIVVRVSDGRVGSEYVIEKDSDLLYINNNLNSNFVLGANLGVDSYVNIDPLGVSGTIVSGFNGSLKGQLTTIIDFCKQTI